MINPEKQYQRNSDYIFRKIVNEMVLVPIHKNVIDMDAIYTLNEMGAFIWEELAEVNTQKVLIEAILDEFEVGQERAREDLVKFLDEMISIGAVREK